MIAERLAADFPAVPEYRKVLATAHNNLGLLLTSLEKGPEAEQQYRNALAIRERLADEFPNVPEYRVLLGGSYCNFATLVRDSGRPEESLGWFEKAIRTLTAVFEQDRRFAQAREFLRNSHTGRAQVYDRLRTFPAAISDWNKAVELSSEREQPNYRAARAISRHLAGQTTEAVAEVAELTKTRSWPVGDWYDFACVYSIASGKGETGSKKQEYADRAIELLKKAVKAGYHDAAHIAKDTDFDAIRGRDDFKELMEELAKRSPAGPETRP